MKNMRGTSWKFHKVLPWLLKVPWPENHWKSVGRTSKSRTCKMFREQKESFLFFFFQQMSFLEKKEAREKNLHTFKTLHFCSLETNFTIRILLPVHPFKLKTERTYPTRYLVSKMMKPQAPCCLFDHHSIHPDMSNVTLAVRFWLPTIYCFTSRKFKLSVLQNAALSKKIILQDVLISSPSSTCLVRSLGERVVKLC